jgi:hypothetical protein
MVWQRSSLSEVRQNRAASGAFAAGNHPTMTGKILSLLLQSLPMMKAGAAVVVTSRGDAPNFFTPLAVPSDNGWNINGGGILDYHFHTDSSFVVAMMSFGTHPLHRLRATAISRDPAGV